VSLCEDRGLLDLNPIRDQILRRAAAYRVTIWCRPRTPSKRLPAGKARPLVSTRGILRPTSRLFSRSHSVTLKPRSQGWQLPVSSAQRLSSPRPSPPGASQPFQGAIHKETPVARTTRQPGGNSPGCTPRRVRIPSSGPSSGAGRTNRTPAQPPANSTRQRTRPSWPTTTSQNYGGRNL
jgi:hypothetical protein